MSGEMLPAESKRPLVTDKSPQLSDNLMFMARGVGAYPEEFYQRSADEVAWDLVGSKITSTVDGVECSGIIVEVEAYVGGDDLETHPYKKPKGMEVDWSPGDLYIYRSYRSLMINITTTPIDEGGAVLIRALEPLDGVEHIKDRRSHRKNLTSGPGNLTQALGIFEINPFLGMTVTGRSPITVQPHLQLKRGDIVTTPRIGIRYSLDLPLRFSLKDNKYVSG